MAFTASVLALATVLWANPQDEQADWPQFLGPRGTAVVTSKPASLLFDFERDVLWRTELPRGSSSPCIVGDRIFLTGSDDDELVMLALDRKSGRELWRRTRKRPESRKIAHVDVDPAAPTPCSDGERVVFYFGGYGLVTLDPLGELLWERPLPVPRAQYGIGTSPIFVDDMLILSRDGCPQSGIYAFAKEDGKERWVVPRQRFTFSFGTPFLWKNANRRELVVAGTRRLTALDPKDGSQLWEIPGLTSFICTTPTSDENTLYFAAWSTNDAAPDERSDASWGDIEFSAEELADGDKALAKLDKNGDGKLEYDELPESRAKDVFASLDWNGDGAIVAKELTPFLNKPKGRGSNLLLAVSAGDGGDTPGVQVRWTYRRGLPYVASPLLYQGRLYLVKAGGLVTCIDPENGKPIFGPERLQDRGEYYSSPVGVDGHVIVCSSGGTISVLRSADEFDLVRMVELGESIHATPAIVGDTIYLRSERGLWAFGR